MGVRRDENYRESWFVRNLTNQKINIGDLPLVPTLSPGHKVDILRFYNREKVSHSVVLTQLVKSGVVSLNKKKIYTNALPGPIPASEVDEAITPAEENELGEIGGGGDGHTHDNLDILDGFSTDSAGNLLWNDGPIEGGGTWIHNDLLGLQGGDVASDEFYHLDYDEYIHLVGGPSYSADAYHTHEYTPYYNIDGGWADSNYYLMQIEGGFPGSTYGGIPLEGDGGNPGSFS